MYVLALKLVDLTITFWDSQYQLEIAQSQQIELCMLEFYT